MIQPRLVFLKLGGSLITDKTKPMTAQHTVIQHLAEEIAAALQASHGLGLLIGHGSGSFGHAVANRYQTQAGGTGPAYWQGFAEVWQAARALNQIVLQALSQADLPVMAFPPSAGVITQNRGVIAWDVQPIKLALSQGLIPVVYGDVVFDVELGGTILSTEALFQNLTREICPDKILIAGLDQGVYAKPEQPDKIIPFITPENMAEVRPALAPSRTVDVTGGMLAKVEAMLSLVAENPALKVHIFSGLEPGNLYKALIDWDAGFGTIVAQQTTPHTEQH